MNANVSVTGHTPGDSRGTTCRLSIREVCTAQVRTSQYEVAFLPSLACLLLTLLSSAPARLGCPPRSPLAATASEHTWWRPVRVAPRYRARTSPAPGRWS